MDLIIKYNKIITIICAFLILVLLTAGSNTILQFILNSGTINNDTNRIFPSNSDDYSEGWNVTWGISGDTDMALDLVTDSSDNIYVVGMSGEMFSMGNLTLSKFSNTGVSLWNVEWGGTDRDRGDAIAIDSSDNIYIAGTTQSFSTGPAGDICLLKYESSGFLHWFKTWGGTTQHDYATDIAVDSEGNIYITGSTKDYGAGKRDMVLLKYNSSGDFQWFKTWGTSEEEWGDGVTIDSSTGDIYIVGTSYYFPTSAWDIFVVGYNSSGEEKWSQTWDGGFSDYGGKISLDSRGGIYVTGMAEKTGGNEDFLLWKINTSGNVEWNRTWGGNPNDRGQDLITDSSDNVYIVGYTQSFGAQNNDVALLKYNYSGFLQWNITWGSSGVELGLCITLDSFEQIYIAGYSRSFGDSWGDNLLLSFLTDNIAPEIIIHSPIHDEIYDVLSPQYNISIIEANLVSTWYTIDGGISNFTVTELLGYIDRDAWFDAPEGPIYIRFYAKDYKNLTSYEEIVIIKKITKLLDIDIIDLIFSTKDFNLTFYIYNETNQGINFASIQMWWNETDVSTDIQNLGNGLYFISLEPIIVAPGEDPILLSMIISAEGYEDKYFETVIAVDPEVIDKKPPDKKAAIPGYNIFFLICVISLISVIFLWKRLKK